MKSLFRNRVIGMMVFATLAFFSCNKENNNWSVTLEIDKETLSAGQQATATATLHNVSGESVIRWQVKMDNNWVTVDDTLLKSGSQATYTIDYDEIFHNDNADEIPPKNVPISVRATLQYIEGKVRESNEVTITFR